jgi:hypothetical protein
MLGLTGTLGAIFLLFGMLFVWIFAGDMRPISEVRLALSTATTRGIVTGVQATNASENDVTVYAYDFSFSTPDEKRYTGRSYTTGQQWHVEDRVSIKYVPDKPSIARIEGTRHSRFSPTVLFVFIFPAIGAAFFITSTIKGWQQVTLLRHGEISGAEIISEQATGTRINEVPVIAYTYEFEAHDFESYLGNAKALPSGRIGDEVREPVLYLPWNPRRSTLVDAIPLRHPLDVDEYGQWTTRGGAGAIVWYALVWVGIAANAAYALVRALEEVLP